MKKIILAAMAVCAVFASCSKDNGGSENEAATLTIKLSGVVQSGTRAVEDPGVTTPGTITLSNGHIFVIDPLGKVIFSEALKVTDATGATGQELTQKVAVDSRVYILGNIPSADEVRITTLTTIGAIQAAASALTMQPDYKKAALANANGQPASIVAGENHTATANISIKPLISRLELVQMKGGENITAFTVTGVYVDSYYPSFTYGGSYAGTMFSQGRSENFTGIGDAGTWAATGSSPLLVAIPEADKVWAHNVAAGGLPRFIIRLTGVKYTENSVEKTFEHDPCYVTVAGYAGVTTFERGKIYRIGGEEGIKFTEDDLGETPNPYDRTMMLNVTVDEWELVTPEAIL